MEKIILKIQLPDIDNWNSDDPEASPQKTYYQTEFDSSILEGIKNCNWEINFHYPELENTLNCSIPKKGKIDVYINEIKSTLLCVPNFHQDKSLSFGNIEVAHNFDEVKNITQALIKNGWVKCSDF